MLQYYSENLNIYVPSHYKIEPIDDTPHHCQWERAEECNRRHTMGANFWSPVEIGLQLIWDAVRAHISITAGAIPPSK